jgi:hypothetical protein
MLITNNTSLMDINDTILYECICLALPDSIKKFKLKSFSLLGLEQALQQRINQHTSRDSDRFRQILKLFKEQTKRGDTDEDTALMGVNRSQFATVCIILSCHHHIPYLSTNQPNDVNVWNIFW